MTHNPSHDKNTDRLAHLTDAQRRAVQTVGHSILVSAAAGSGKTTVLAERCAALVCDLPTDQRCGIDELLVVTFTEAAAGEMRTRIGKAIQQRSKDNPNDGHLKRQQYLIDSASISTIHAFCKTVIQRWFPQAGIDPQASVLSGPEAELLRRETVEQLFLDLYGDNGEQGKQFQSLIDDYGGGNDATIQKIVLRIANFLGSLPEPDEWLARAGGFDDAAIDASQTARLIRELAAQHAYCLHLAETINSCWPIADIHIDAVTEHSFQLDAWRSALDEGGHWETVAAEIRAFEFGRAKSKPRGLSTEDGSAYDAAKALRDKMKTAFTNRLQEGICRFTAAEYRQGLECIAPYVHTLTSITQTFTERFNDAKAQAGAIDFNDMQRYAYDLLRDSENPDQPSEVARQLQRRYRYVLIDEFQDVDPLQESILRFVSRETAEPLEGNLFTVGDIKQSIYRFRLAEPELFSHRAEMFDDNCTFGKLIGLQENFRSRQSIVDAVNEVFRPLMRHDFGGSDYNTQAELHAGATYPESSDVKTFDQPAVELHLLESVTEQTRPGNDDSDNDNTNDSEPSNDELEGIEREGYLIGQRINEWMGNAAGSVEGSHVHVADRPATPGGPPTLRPLAYKDIVILLRSMPRKAEPIADILNRMGIPTRVAVASAGIDSTEFRDCVSLLQVLDNAQQDIPLAAVMRSPFLTQPFDETELLNIRLAHRTLPFHQAVMTYGESGNDQPLRDRVRETLTRLKRWRDRVQREPVAEVMWDILQETSYFAYVAGLPDGRRRRGTLIQLHELARQFGQFARQGLRRFLRFIDDVIEQDNTLPAAAAETNDNVVRIMTIHASKGLEFPVVILADAAKQFNLADMKGPVLIDRALGVCMSAADPDRRVYYPTLPRQLAAENEHRETLSEELRVLYVAMTRAREHLLIVGRTGKKTIDSLESLIAQGQRMTPVPLQLEMAVSPLDWVTAAITAMPTERVGCGDDPKPRLFQVHTYERASTDEWQIPCAIEPSRIDSLNNIAALKPLDSDEPIAPTDALIEPLLRSYPGLELTTIPARAAFRDIKRPWDSTFEADEQPTVHAANRPALAEPSFVAPSESAPLQRGSATHRFCQLIDLQRPCDHDDLSQQLKDCITAGTLPSKDESLVMLDAAAWFFATDLGQRILSSAHTVLREVPFVGRVKPSQYLSDVEQRDHRDVILVRGVADLVLDCGDSIEILDYKTDRITADQCVERAKRHQAQLDHYAAALTDIYGKPVTRRWLAFLEPQQIVECPAG